MLTSCRVARSATDAMTRCLIAILPGAEAHKTLWISIQRTGLAFWRSDVLIAAVVGQMAGSARSIRLRPRVPHRVIHQASSN